MSYEWARPGAKVVCVDASDLDCVYGEALVREGTIYTIREVRPTMTSVRLIEIVNEPREYKAGLHECWYKIHRFRPLVDTSRQVSALRELAIRAAQSGKVDA